MGFLAGLGGAQAPAGVMGFPAPGPAQPVGPQVAQQPQFQQPRKPHGVGNFLGHLGDALLVASGRGPMYAPMIAQREAQERQQQVGQMLGNVLGRLDPSLRDLVAADPGTGLEIFKLLHPQQREADTPSAVREFEYFSGLDPAKQKSYRGFRRDTRPQIIGSAEAGYSVVDPDSFGDDAPEAGEVTATGPNGEKIKLNPTTGQWEPVGGPTAQPSGGFRQ